MKVTIDGVSYCSVEEVREILMKALKFEKKDCFNKDEEDGFELAEHRIAMELEKMCAEVSE